jgi:thioredoxin 1
VEDYRLFKAHFESDKKMNTPNEQSRGPVEEIGPTMQTAAAGGNAAKLSIVAAVIVIGLNWAGVTVLEGRSTALTAVRFAAMAAVLAGVIGAAAGLIRAWKCRGKNVMPLAVAGLLLNGALLATGFVKAPILGRQYARPNKLSAKELDTRPLSAKSSRTIVTEDWTAGFVTELTDYTFDDVIKDSDIPVLVDFWAPWCGPCRMMSPVIEELARYYQGKAKVCKLNVDNARETASEFRVSGIPTIILFKNGRVKKKWTGVTSRQEISAAINRLL